MGYAAIKFVFSQLFLKVDRVNFIDEEDARMSKCLDDINFVVDNEMVQSRSLNIDHNDHIEFLCLSSKKKSRFQVHCLR